ncbi:hypothetical protein F383_26514 [Gossypium arboreum]|uniref:Uncharacterized protein n=1 Tax=Gossypium arboreum TaxID=29729 RepID=A0A0B0P8E1_GOSAR|nr:hypothetical protein F383_26514 [Gossypium arboreum]
MESKGVTDLAIRSTTHPVSNPCTF